MRLMLMALILSCALACKAPPHAHEREPEQHNHYDLRLSWKWEYKVMNLTSGPMKGDTEMFNKLGADRWELVVVYGPPAGVRRMILKRPKIE